MSEAQATSKKIENARQMRVKSAPVSASTQQLIISRMQNMKLSWSQQKRLISIMKVGGHFPMSAAESNKSQPLGRRKSIQEVTKKRGMRSRESIEQSGAYERERYNGIPSLVDKSQEKERLQNFMAYGTDKPLDHVTFHKTKPTTTNEPVVNRFDEVLSEIEERHAFLKEMKALGLEKEYRSIILSQIPEKLYELRRLDKERCERLYSALTNPV